MTRKAVFAMDHLEERLADLQHRLHSMQVNREKAVQAIQELDMEMLRLEGEIKGYRDLLELAVANDAI